MPRKSKTAPPPLRAVLVETMRSVHSAGSRKRVAAAEKRVGALRTALSKKFDGEVITTIAGGGRDANIRAVPSGWGPLDDLLTGETDDDARTVVGSGLGWPRGRIVEIYGAPGMGKTTLALLAVAAFQRAGEVAAFVDAEHALDVSYAAKLGVDLRTMLFIQPDSGGEQALDIVMSLAESGAVGVIVVDSVAALTPLAELELDLDDASQPGGHARLMSRALRKLASIVRNSNVLLVFINQTRMKIGVRFGNPVTTTGGQALMFYASIRLEMVNVKTQKKGDRVVHRRTRVRTVKNKVAPPFRDVYVDLAPNKGIVAVHGDAKFDKADDGDDKSQED